MSTRLDIAKRLYRGKTVAASGSRGAAVAGGVVGTPTGDTQIRYGYATADSANGWVTVRLDTAASAISCVCDSPIKSGQRVAVFTTSAGQLKAQPIGQNIVDEAVDEATQDVADQIQQAGQQILDDVNAEMDEWKQDHQLTDADINHSIQTAVSGATETWEGELSSVENDIETNYALKTEVTQGIDGLRTEISETYATSEGVTNEINTAITQASGQIESTVEQNVMDSVGNTYATKTELTQTSSNLQLNITAAQNDATDALDKANEVSTYFNADATGLEIGQEGNPVSVLMASDGSFKVLYNGEAVSLLGDTYSKIGTSLAGTGTSYATLDIYGGTLTYNIQPPSTDIGQGGYFQFLAPTVEMRSDLDSTTYVRVAANGLVYIGSNKRSGVLSDWVTNNSTSGNWTIREHASGFAELMEVIDMDFPVGGSTQSVSLPVTFDSWQDYQVHLQLLGDTTNYASHFNNIALMAHSFTANSFVIGAWNSANVAVNGRYRVAVHVTGMSS